MEIILTVILGVLGFPVVVHYLVDSFKKRGRRMPPDRQLSNQKPIA